MRVLMQVRMPVEAGNDAAREGELGSTIQSILEELKPEAAYFTAIDGMRTGLLFFDLPDASHIPAVAEPWFLAFEADIELVPVMTPEDLAKGAEGIEAAVAKYG